MPLVTLDDADDAFILGKALMECGLPVVEITFRTDAAEKAIKLLKSTYPEILVGAGTILTPQMAETAINAGAEFILAPGINPEVVRYCQSREVLSFPGCMTPSDLELAKRLELKCVKIFPIVSIGGLAMLKAISAPFPGMKYLATGGIKNSNLAEYLQFPSVVACGGSWIIKKENLKSSNLKALKKDIDQAIVQMLGLRLSLGFEENCTVLEGSKNLKEIVIETIDFGRAVKYFRRKFSFEEEQTSVWVSSKCIEQKAIFVDRDSNVVIHLAGRSYGMQSESQN